MNGERIKHIFYSNYELPEVRAYCRKERISITDIFLEMKKHKKEKQMRDFKRIISILRIGKKKNHACIVGNECEEIAYEIYG